MKIKTTKTNLIIHGTWKHGDIVPLDQAQQTNSTLFGSEQTERAERGFDHSGQFNISSSSYINILKEHSYNILSPRTPNDSLYCQNLIHLVTSKLFHASHVCRETAGSQLAQSEEVCNANPLSWLRLELHLCACSGASASCLWMFTQPW